LSLDRSLDGDIGEARVKIGAACAVFVGDDQDFESGTAHFATELLNDAALVGALGFESTEGGDAVL
jgi:hypothetical protein